MHTNKKSFSVRTERYSRDLTKEVQFLLPAIPTLYIKDVDEICWFSHCHELPIRCVANRPDGSDVATQYSNWFGEIADVPDPACLVLVSSGKCSAIWIPCWRKGVIQMATEFVNRLQRNKQMQACIWIMYLLYQVSDCTPRSTYLSWTGINHKSIRIVPHNSSKFTIRAQWRMLQKIKQGAKTGFSNVFLSSFKTRSLTKHERWLQRLNLNRKLEIQQVVQHIQHDRQLKNALQAYIHGPSKTEVIAYLKSFHVKVSKSTIIIWRQEVQRTTTTKWARNIIMLRFMHFNSSWTE